MGFFLAANLSMTSIQIPFHDNPMAFPFE